MKTYDLGSSPVHRNVLENVTNDVDVPGVGTNVRVGAGLDELSRLLIEVQPDLLNGIG